MMPSREIVGWGNLRDAGEHTRRGTEGAPTSLMRATIALAAPDTQTSVESLGPSVRTRWVVLDRDRMATTLDDHRECGRVAGNRRCGLPDHAAVRARHAGEHGEPTDTPRTEGG